MNLLRRLFRKKAAPPAAASAPAAAPALVEAPAYYEVWGGLESANRALWLGLWFSITVALLCLVLVRLLLTRPPVVIRVADAGAAQVVSEPGRQPPVGEAEIKNFLSLFERFFWGLNYHGYEGDLKTAFTMMTPNFRPKADELLKREGIVELIQANQSKVTVTLTDLEVLRDTPVLLECRVLGSRQLTSYKPEGPSGEVVFEHNIILRKVPRSEDSPYGVLVEDFKERVFKRQ